MNTNHFATEKCCLLKSVIVELNFARRTGDHDYDLISGSVDNESVGLINYD